MRLLPFLAVAAVLCGASTAHATSISIYSGSFASDDDRFEVSFTLASSTQVSMQTWSYGGGTDPNGDVVTRGGFATVLSLFDPLDTLLALDTGGTAPNSCDPREIDAFTGFCLDAFLSPILGPGTYRLVLTEYDNIPRGPAYVDGFLQDGQGNFTGGPFKDPDGNQRTSSYTLSISSSDATPVPEPATLVTLAAGLVLCGAARRRRKRPTRSNPQEIIQ